MYYWSNTGESKVKIRQLPIITTNQAKKVKGLVFYEHEGKNPQPFEPIKLQKCQDHGDIEWQCDNVIVCKCWNVTVSKKNNAIILHSLTRV